MTGSSRARRIRTLAALVASLALTVATGLAFSAASAGPASAGTPCSTEVRDDWFDDGILNGEYPRHCYTEAIQHLPRDVDTYSNAAEEIRAAMLAAFQHKGNGNPPSGGTSQPSGSKENVTPADPSATAAPPKSNEPKRGLILKAIEWLGPSDASAVPLPILILAAAAFLLLAAAAGSLLNRRLQERQPPPPPRA